MEITEIEVVQEWLNQFSIPDLYLAEYLVKKMRYVSFEEYETWLHSSVNSLIQDIIQSEGKKVGIALFPVKKQSINKFNSEKELKNTNDSSGRMAHSLKNIERNLPTYVELTPRIESMRASKVKHIIFIDDFIGTGKRFIDSWKTTVPKNIKSWASYGWCKIWLLSFAGHSKGIQKIVNQVKAINTHQILVNLKIDQSFILENKDLKELVSKYGVKTNKPTSKLGYGDIASPIVFQYGCPNNVPVIFWAKGTNKKRNRWKPLFPERSVSTSTYFLFNSDFSKDTVAEDLWMLQQYHLALQFINSPHFYKDDHQLLLLLTYLNKQKNIEKIRNALILTENEFNDKLRQLEMYGLIKENTITHFGKEILKRGKNATITPCENKVEYSHYFPSTFSGFQRDI